ncbi:zinc finger MYM-type containing 1 [Chelydra serpentina]|uniref:Zinc finger MYM-type containing 1 n=1 Tax=Chelydra serpentina TaxID=8475 RepID=A0A8T1SXY0_CHESE|nr:zinc finger MYM-type containing 1 [Chelydra serpentina]
MRNWLIFSETTKAISCYVCKLFPDHSKGKQTFVNGHSNWRNISRHIADHETSKAHINAICKFVQRYKVTQNQFFQISAQFEKECSYWRKVLRCVVAIVKLLSSLGLPLRGHDESLLSNQKDNFLTCFENLNGFDNILNEDLKNYQYCGSEKTNFLTHQTYNEFITIMAEQLRNQFTDEVKDAKYYSIVVDSTPDVSHVDQLTLMLRYVTGNGEVVEQFLCFVLLKSHASECLETTVLEIIANVGFGHQKFSWAGL